MRTLLFELWFGDVWYNRGVGDVFILCFGNMCVMSLNMVGKISESRASFYLAYKLEFVLSHHTDVVCVKSLRNVLNCVMRSSPSLRIEVGCADFYHFCYTLLYTTLEGAFGVMWWITYLSIYLSTIARNYIVDCSCICITLHDMIKCIWLSIDECIRIMDEH